MPLHGSLKKQNALLLFQFRLGILMCCFVADEAQSQQRAFYICYKFNYYKTNCEFSITNYFGDTNRLSENVSVRNECVKTSYLLCVK